MANYGNTKVTRHDGLGGPQILLSDVSPVQSFSRELLRRASSAIEPYILLEGDTITIEADNGRWIWRIFDEDEHCVHGRWPD
jgi:hypothetical protein